MAFKQNMLYEIEWEDINDNVYEFTLYARSASQAEDKAEKILKAKPEFARITCVNLDD